MLMSAKAFEQGEGRVAIGHNAELGLDLADGIAQIEVEMPGEITHTIAKLRELFLQRDALLDGKLPVALRPCGADRTTPLHPVGEVRGRQRIDIRIVVPLDHLEIIGDEKRRSSRPAREE